MSITSDQLVWRYSKNISDSASNGGRMSFTESVDGVKNNGFPDILEAERVAGSTKYRKLFLHVNNGETSGINTGLPLVQPRVFVETRTPGEDSINFFPGTQRDQQSAITGSEDLYGMAVLEDTVTAGATEIVVTVEDWTNLPIFRNGDLIRISDKTSVTDSGNNEEYRTINGAPSAVGNEVTITLDSALANGYLSGAKVSSVYTQAEVDCAVSNFSNNGSGSFSVDGIATEQEGTIEQDWTLTFTSATAYTVSGDEVGSVGTGNVGSDFAPSNPATSASYFRLLSSEFGGTFVAGQTITFTTSPSGIPVWFKRSVPAGASSLSGNSLIMAVDGEST